MPRASVDIDLAFLPITDRNTALDAIQAELAVIADNIRRLIPQVQVIPTSKAIRLVVSLNATKIWIEANPIVRGSLFEPVKSTLCEKAQEQYEQVIEIRRLAVEELYGGKLCAALDRQHPRDLFDIMLLQNAGNISDGIRQAFVVYLVGCNRPMYEILAPNRKPLDELFA